MISKTILILLALTIFSLTSCLEKKEAPESVEASIQQLLDRNGEAYLSKNIDALMKDYAKDAAVFAGAKNDSYIGRAAIKKIFKEEFDNLDWKMDDYEYTNLRIKYSGNVAWVSTDIKSYMTYKEEKITGEGRHTMVANKIDDKWLFVMSHFQLFPEEKPAEQEDGKEQKKSDDNK
ncbi:MAG: nuclear transport factor 2 family protein [Candidatus Kapabacteria bacterium]|jgi:ketosteroid isomerase-like protein|nr:nuclear transport factor 2 family protein [Candidatus Kapabacteria bacterium]